MLKKIAIALLVVIAVFMLVVAMQPNEFKIQRSTLVSAPASRIYPIISDLHRWDDWSPWSKMDPAMKKSFEGPAKGLGAIYSWEGNDKVGTGRQTITAVTPNERVEIKLEFMKPWQATNTVEFLLREAQDGVQVVWSMSGKNNFMGKAFGLLMNMDKMVGGDFEKGLASLKELAEKAPATPKKK